jgi:hypothetical protein
MSLVFTGFIILVCFFGCSVTPEDSAILLASSPITFGGGAASVATGVVLIFGIGIMPGESGIFDDIVLIPDNVGLTYTVTSSDDGDFATVTDALTNGIDDMISVELSLYPDGGGDGNGISESGVFLGGETGECIPDFVGFQIDYFGITSNSLTLDVPGSDPNKSGIWTDYSVDLQLKAHGHRF